MANNKLIPFESEPMGPNVEYLIRVSRFDQKENYCWGGPFESHKDKHRLYLPLTGSAFTAVGMGIFGLLYPRGIFYHRRLLPLVTLDVGWHGFTHKWQVFAAYKDELKYDDCIPEADPELYSWCAERVWICQSFDSVTDAMYYQKKKRKIQSIVYGEKNGH